MFPLGIKFKNTSTALFSQNPKAVGFGKILSHLHFHKTEDASEAVYTVTQVYSVQLFLWVLRTCRLSHCQLQRKDAVESS